MGPDGLSQFKKMAMINSLKNKARMQAEEENDDIPDLVKNFEDEAEVDDGVKKPVEVVD